jgi:hypothetical protein
MILPVPKGGRPILFLLIVLSFSGCLTTKRVDSWINTHYGDGAMPTARRCDYIQVKTPDPVSSTPISITEKHKSKLIPALFYWKWKYGTKSTLNGSIPGKYFSSAAIPYANSKKLKEKLNGQTLELSIENMPAQFSMIYDGGAIFLLLWYVSWESVYVDPIVQDMVVNYRLLRDNVETKTGTITIEDRNRAFQVKMFKSAKKTFWNYLDQYNTNIQSMSRQVIDRLIAEI